MDSGHYVYGKLYGQLAKWAYQYAHPIMMTAIPRVALKWHATDSRRIGIGDISMAGGPKSPDHNTHRSGLEVDVRPLRKDGLELRDSDAHRRTRCVCGHQQHHDRS
ncbi:penicillin-insensitive murein endopeptidase [Massilia timonae]